MSDASSASMSSDFLVLAPPLPRRLAAFVYEGVLLFGVVMAAGIPYAAWTGHRHALEGRAGFMAFLFVVLGVYFVWFWSRGRQTLPMKTWRMRLVTAQGEDLTPTRAAWRYACCWLWFLPAWALSAGLGLRGSLTLWATLVWVLLWAGMSRLRADRQFLHDVLAGTRIMSSQPVPRAQAKSQG